MLVLNEEDARLLRRKADLLIVAPGHEAASPDVERVERRNGFNLVGRDAA